MQNLIYAHLPPTGLRFCLIMCMRKKQCISVFFFFFSLFAALNFNVDITTLRQYSSTVVRITNMVICRNVERSELLTQNMLLNS